MYNYRQHDLTERTAAMLEWADAKIDSLEPVCDYVNGEWGEHYVPYHDAGYIERVIFKEGGRIDPEKYEAEERRHPAKFNRPDPWAAWLNDPANEDNPLYSDIFKDVYGFRP